MDICPTDRYHCASPMWKDRPQDQIAGCPLSAHGRDTRTPGHPRRPATGDCMTKDTGPTLRIVTATEPEPCDGTYTCPCHGCRSEVDQLVARGPRRTAPLPLRRAA